MTDGTYDMVELREYVDPERPGGFIAAARLTRRYEASGSRVQVVAANETGALLRLTSSVRVEGTERYEKQLCPVEQPEYATRFTATDAEIVDVDTGVGLNGIETVLRKR